MRILNWPQGVFFDVALAELVSLPNLDVHIDQEHAAFDPRKGNYVHWARRGRDAVAQAASLCKMGSIR